MFLQAICFEIKSCLLMHFLGRCFFSSDCLIWGGASRQFPDETIISRCWCSELLDNNHFCFKKRFTCITPQTYRRNIWTSHDKLVVLIAILRSYIDAGFQYPQENKVL